MTNPEPELILASASPRRSALLRDAGFNFRVVPSHAEELSSSPEYIHSIALRNAELKAHDIALKFPDAVIIGADTVIEFGTETIGKPKDLADARRILRSLSAKTHTVTTGVCVEWISKDVRTIFADRSHVTFRTLSDETISEYLRLVYVLDKAGAYGIQEHGDMLVAHVEGAMSNIVGLPVERLTETLRLLQIA